jgi:hypothetical protein
MLRVDRRAMMTRPTPTAPIAQAMFFALQFLSMRTWLETERRRKKNVRSLGATQCALEGRTILEVSYGHLRPLSFNACPSRAWA